MSTTVRFVTLTLRPAFRFGDNLNIVGSAEHNIIIFIRVLYIGSSVYFRGLSTPMICLDQRYCCCYYCTVISRLILLAENFLPFDWLRAELFQLNLKYLNVKITVTMVTQNHQIISLCQLRKNGRKLSRFCNQEIQELKENSENQNS